MKVALLPAICCLLLLWVLSSGQSYVNIVWEQRYGAHDPAYSPTHSGGIGLAFRNGPGQQDYLYVAAQNWWGTGAEWASCALIKYRIDDGSKEWDVGWMAGYAEYWLPMAICLDRTGNVYVTGTELDAAGNNWHAMRAYKITADGNQVWRARYRQVYNNSYDIVADENGCAYITGSGGYNLSNWDARTIKYADTANVNGIGISLWNKAYDGSETANDFDEFYAIAQDSSGFIYVTGGCCDSLTGVNFITVKYNSQTGDTIWTRKYDGSSSTDYAQDVVIGDLDCVYVTGQSRNALNQLGLVTIKYDPNGNAMWTTRYDSTGASFDPKEMAVDHSGNVYVTGQVSGSGINAYFTAKYSATGNIEWIRLLSGGDVAHGIALDISGNVYVTGESDGDDYLTVKYNSAGELIWQEWYDWDMGFDWAFDIVVDNADFVYVTGLSEDPSLGRYFTTTIKYEQVLVGADEECQTRYPGTRASRLMVYPNPFSVKLEIAYAVHDAGHAAENVSLKIYDISGKIVKDLSNKLAPYIKTANHESRCCWYGDDVSGDQVPAGVYFCRIQCGAETLTKKIMKIR